MLNATHSYQYVQRFQTIVWLPVFGIFNVRTDVECYPFLSVCAVFSCVQSIVWLPVFGGFNVRADVDSCEYTVAVRIP